MTSLPHYRGCKNLLWGQECNCPRREALAERERLRKRVSDLENLAREAEDIFGELDDDNSPLDIGDWRCCYRELGLLRESKGGSDDA